MSDGTIRVWGYCKNGIGNNIDDSGRITTPYDPGIHSPHLYDSPIVKVDCAGAYYSGWETYKHSQQLFALRADGTLWTSGQNHDGVLGYGESTHANAGNVHDGWAGGAVDRGASAQEHRSAWWTPWTRYWNAYRSGDLGVGGSGTHQFDEEGWRGHGSMNPMRQGLHRYTDFVLYSGQSGDNSSDYYNVCFMLNELGVLECTGDGSHDSSTKEVWTGTDYMLSPSPINFP